jgi:hypothetical protein
MTPAAPEELAKVNRTVDEALSLADEAESDPERKGLPRAQEGF